MLVSLCQKMLRSSLASKGLRSQYLETRYGRIHRLEGTGGGQLPPIVLVHGVGANAVSFYSLILRLLPHTRRLIAMDLLAHGGSQVPVTDMNYGMLRDAAVETLCSILDEPAIFFGNSLGGGVSLYFALTNPTLVHSLVLASPAGAPLRDGDLSAIRSLFHIDSEAKARAFLRRVFHRSPAFLALIASRHLVRVYMAPAIRALFASLKPGETVDPELLRKLSRPIYVMWGSSDRILPMSHLSYFRQTLPDSAKLEELNGLGHCPFLERPGFIAQRVLDFVRGLDRDGEDGDHYISP